MPNLMLRVSWRFIYRFCQVYGYRWNARIRYRLRSFIAYIGRWVLFLIDLLKQMIFGPWRMRATIAQMNFIGQQSLPLTMLVALVTGGIFALQMGDVFGIFNSLSYIGVVTISALMRELAPVLTGFLIAGRAGSAMTAQIATMKSGEQIDALEMMAVSPVSYLIVPRFLGCLLSAPLICSIFMVVGSIGAWIVSRVIFGVEFGSFLNHILEQVILRDLVFMISKSFVFGMVVGLITCFVGLNAPKRGGGVGGATTKAVVRCFLLILVIDVVMVLIDQAKL